MAAPVETMLESNEGELKQKFSRNVDKNLLDSFWDLSKTKQSIRLHAAISIFRLLYEKQKKLEESDLEAKHSDLEYTVQRLVRGLASSRQASRQGFCLALTEILRYFTVVTVEDVIGHVEKDLSFHNKLEKCHIVIGRALAYAAIVRSDRLKNDPYISFVVINLFDLSIGKTYIQQFVYKLMVELYAQINADIFKNLLWSHLKKKFSCGWEKCNPDILWFFILTLRIFPEAISQKFLKKYWQCEDLLSIDNLSQWQSIIKQSTTVHPQVHPVCLEFLNLSIQKKVLQNYWPPLIDDTLFENDQNEKAYLGLMMLKEALSLTNKKRIVKTIFSPKLCTTLTKCSLNKKHSLHSVANDLIVYLGQYVNGCQDHQIQILILKSFLLQPRASLTAQILRKKEIVLMMSHFTKEAVSAFYEILRSIIFERKTTFEDEDSDRKPHIAIFQIGLLVSHPSVVNDIDWQMNVLKFLFTHSFYVVKEPIEELTECNVPTNWMPVSLKTAFVNSFIKALDFMCRKTESKTSLLKHQLQVLTDIVNFAELLLGKANLSLEPTFPLEKVKESWERMRKVVHKLQKYEKKSAKENENHAFQILFLQLGLLLFQEQESISNVLEELEVCYKKQKETSTDSDEQHPWIQVIVDILLSLLSQQSHHMRCVISSVFPLICPFMTKESLQLILDVLNPEKDESPLDDDDEDIEFDSGESSSSDDEENEPSNEDANVELKSKLQKVLGTVQDGSDAESIVLSDSEMFKLDETLSEVFRSQKKTGHTQLNQEQKSLMNFQIKCLDLLCLYLKEGPPLANVIQLIKPVLALYETSRHHRQQATLTFKTLTTLKIISKMKKFQNYENIQSETLEAILEELIARCHNETDISVAKYLYSLCLFMVLCEQKVKSIEKNVSGKILKMKHMGTLKKYHTALDDFVKKSNSHIIPEMFTMLMNTYPEYAWNFVATLEKYAFDEPIRLYRKTQCLGLILTAIKASKGKDHITKEMWIEFANNLKLKSVTALKQSLSGMEFKPLYVTELLCLLQLVLTILKDNKIPISEPELLDLLMKMNSEKCNRLVKGKQVRRQVICLLGGVLPTKPKKDKTLKETTNENKGHDVTETDNVSNLSKKRKKQKQVCETSKKMKSFDKTLPKVKSELSNNKILHSDNSNQSECD